MTVTSSLQTSLSISTICIAWLILRIYDVIVHADAQKEVDRVWQDQDAWVRRCIRNTAGTGMFSSDRSILQYANEIWDAKVFLSPSLSLPLFLLLTIRCSHAKFQWETRDCIKCF